MTAFATAETAIAAMKAGAYDYLTKPFKVDEVGLVVERALERRVLQHQNVVLRDEIKGRYKLDRLIGKSPAMHRVFEVVRKIASGPHQRAADRRVGDRQGAGRARPARAVGAGRPRLHRRQLRGHPRVAHRVRVLRARQGLLHRAPTPTAPACSRRPTAGTIFLDEIGELPVPMQVKLLRVLQERKVKRVGGVQEKEVDVRVVAATNRDLETEVEKGTFRQDLFYRLNVIQLRLPPLRERREDIPILVDHFVRKLAAEHGRQITGVDPDAMSALMGHSFPGNVRELENLIERAVTLAPGDRISLGHPAHPRTRSRRRAPGWAPRPSCPTRGWTWRRWWRTSSGASSSRPWSARGATAPRRPACWASPSARCATACPSWASPAAKRAARPPPRHERQRTSSPDRRPRRHDSGAALVAAPRCWSSRAACCWPALAAPAGARALRATWPPEADLMYLPPSSTLRWLALGHTELARRPGRRPGQRLLRHPARHQGAAATGWTATSTPPSTSTPSSIGCTPAGPPWCSTTGARSRPTPCSRPTPSSSAGSRPSRPTGTSTSSWASTSSSSWPTPPAPTTRGCPAGARRGWRRSGRPRYFDGVPYWLPGLAARLLTKQGAEELAVRQLEQAYAVTSSERDPEEIRSSSSALQNRQLCREHGGGPPPVRGAIWRAATPTPTRPSRCWWGPAGPRWVDIDPARADPPGP